ncbi:MAG: hypothetical protein Q8N18_06025 [Opitutaceae bacterium]|nr:hypothetical protein [Opitutaceae bacterium]
MNNPAPAPRAPSASDPLFDTSGLDDYDNRQERVRELVATGCFDSEHDAMRFLNILVREAEGEALVPALRSIVDSTRDLVNARLRVRRERDEAQARQEAFDSLAAELVRLERVLKAEKDRAAGLSADDAPAVEYYIDRIALSDAHLMGAINFSTQLSAERDLLQFLNSAVIPELERRVAVAGERLATFGAHTECAGDSPAVKPRPAAA